MSLLTKRTASILTCIIALLAASCSDPRKTLINSDTGKHTTAQWSLPDNHGAQAKAAPSSTSGFAVCQECHKEDYSGGISNVSCLKTAGCHGANVGAPHAAAPWRGGTRTHTNTNPDNAPVCALCHTNGANAPIHPSPFDAGAAPGCFNNTLCHGAVVHAAGWALPTAHGATAKSAPAATSGFSYCQNCHGSDFTGGTALQTCLNAAGCHGVGVNAPHAFPWVPGSTYVHTTTDTGNAPLCALCHLGGRTPPSYATVPGGTTPGCFNNTLCHGVVGQHPSGWALPTAHGTTAKSAPAVASGFSYCQNCHGNDFTGGLALKTCLNTAGCHGVGVNAPHAFPWIPGSTYVHTTTDTGNAPVCALCHLGGRTPPSYAAVPTGTTPGCFNSTLCHGAVGHPSGWALPTAHGATAKAAPAAASGFSYCQTCHGNDFTGGTALQTCLNTAGCHGVGVMSPHPSAWSPDSTYKHNTTNQANAGVCALCHLGGRTPPSYATVPAGTTPGCFNSTLCHGTQN